MFRIRRFNCWWDCYKKVKYNFADKIDNDFVGIILFYIIYYLVSIIGLVVFLSISFVKYFITLRKIKFAIKTNNENVIKSLLKNKYIKEVTND